MSRQSSFSIELHLLADWCRQRPLRLCVLFGSQATGKARARSDVDLAIWPIEAMTLDQRLQWLMELENMLGRDVSLVAVTPRLNPTLGFEIVKHGIVVHEAEPDLWQRERSRLWHLYCDSLPFRRAARRTLDKFVEELKHGA